VATAEEGKSLAQEENGGDGGLGGGKRLDVLIFIPKDLKQKKGSRRTKPGLEIPRSRTGNYLFRQKPGESHGSGEEKQDQKRQ